VTNEEEFMILWGQEKNMYGSWGEYIISTIFEYMESEEKINPQLFFKIPVKRRLKDDASLLDKAFYRGKLYDNPYQEIQDKVGVRFVVMLHTDVEKTNEIIKKVSENNDWHLDMSRDHISERDNSPMTFTYQSDHFILQNNNDIKFNNTIITRGTTCEIQVRSLLQHAYAEVTHDTTYKRKTSATPDVIRTIAKTMAFIETADDFFVSVTEKTNQNMDIRIEQTLDPIFHELTSIKPISLNSSKIIFDTFEDHIDECTAKIENFLSKNMYLMTSIQERSTSSDFYKQSVILFIYWLIKTKKYDVQDRWPLNWKIIIALAQDLGMSLKRHT